MQTIHNFRSNDIKDETFISYTQDAGITTIIQTALKEKFGPCYEMKTLFSANEPNTLTHLISEGLGIGFITENPSLSIAKIKLFSLSDVSLYHPIYLVWKTNAYMPPVVKAFRQFVLEYKE